MKQAAYRTDKYKPVALGDRLKIKRRKIAVKSFLIGAILALIIPVGTAQGQIAGSESEQLVSAKAGMQLSVKHNSSPDLDSDAIRGNATRELPRIIPEPAFVAVQGEPADGYEMEPASASESESTPASPYYYSYRFKLTGGAGQNARRALTEKQISGRDEEEDRHRNKDLTALLLLMQRQLQTTLGRGATATKPAAKPGHADKVREIVLELNPDLDFKELRQGGSGRGPVQEATLREAYKLHIGTGGIKIAARSQTGLYYGVQTLLQIIDQYKKRPAMVVAKGGAGERTHILLPPMEVQDAPVYSWRGFMLDVSRHFYTTAEIKKLLDVMSRYKLNVFHWHLTDDQGWRLEIRRYPRLTSIGAWRQQIPGSVFFNKRPDTLKGKHYRYGGFYTQKEAREIVHYAALRGITVVPEIELPGHAAAALAAYPAYSSTGRAQGVPSSMGYPKGAVSEYNPGNPKTFTFLENILTEVMEIFPSTYIHIGGDEVDKTNWKKNPGCKTLMEKEGLKDYEALQSYFINKIGRFLEKHGRKIIGWDEALEGDLLPSATITYWRSYAKKAPLKAVSEGHGFINVCSDPLYFNRYQAGPAGEPLAAPHSMNTLKRVYQYQMMPAGLTAAQQRLVKGGQAAIWTEFFSDPGGMEYMLLPRLLALSENLWTQQRNKDYPAFYQTLPRELRFLGAQGYNYRRLDK